MTTIVSILAQQARRRPDRLFVRFPESDLTYAAFDSRVRRLASGLRRRGVAGLGGDRILPTLLPNCADAAALWFAATRAGAVWAPINTEFRGQGLAHAINLTQARDLVVDRSLMGPVLAVADRLECLERLIVRGGGRPAESSPGAGTPNYPPAGSGNYGDGPGAPSAPRNKSSAPHPFATLPLSALDLDDDGTPPVAPDSAADPALLIYTSGTTGMSKACELSHRYVLGQSDLLARYVQMRSDDVVYCPYPIFHWDAIIGTIAPALLRGATAVVAERFSVSRFWPDVRRYGVTIFDFMGATLTFLHKQEPRPDDADNPARLAWGVPMPSFKADFERRFGLTLIEGYGSTEIGVAVGQDPGRAYPEGACGRCLPEFRLRIVDADDRPVPNGEIGEIAARPANDRDRHLMLTGYYRNPERDAEAFRGGWFHTGDLGRLDDDGNLYFEGRKKDAIRRRGENISAFEIEQAIETHPAVLEAAAYGVPSEYTEEEVAVAVALRPGRALTMDELLAHCRGRMADYMVPEHVRFLDKLPKTPTEKTAKTLLRKAHVKTLRASNLGAASQSMDQVPVRPQTAGA